MDCLKQLESPLINEIRGKGLFIGLDVDSSRCSGRALALEMMKHGVLTRETHGTVIRLAPPLVIEKEQLDQAVSAIEDSLSTLLN